MELRATHGDPQEARICLEVIPRKWNGEVLYGGLPGRKPKLPKPPSLPSHLHRHRFLDTCQSVARKALKQLCQNYSREIFETPLRYFPPSNKNTPTWRKRLQALSGRDPTEDDPTIVYMVGYLHTLDNHYDDLSYHCTHLNSRVESLE
jgi:hypothetical protein